MSEAVEGAELMLYGVSEKYKERCESFILDRVELPCADTLLLFAAPTAA